MKKSIAFIGIITLIILALAVFLFKQNKDARGQQALLGAKDEKAELLIKKVRENTKKYHPQKTSKTIESGLYINAKSAILIDENTNTILYAKNVHEILPPASITKVATLAVALESIKKDQPITISEKAAGQEPNKIVMKAGERLRAEDLFYGLMMISANDAAWAIAESVPGGYDGFIKRMNEKAKWLGLSDSNFVNPAGLDDPAHLTTVFDIATFTRYDLLEHPEFIQYAGEKNDYSVYPTDHNESHWWSHISGMLYRYPGMVAAKTGYTDIAHSTFVGVADRSGRRLAVVFMGSTDANKDVQTLFNWGFAQK